MSGAQEHEDFASVEDIYQHLLSRAPEDRMAPRLDAVAAAVAALGDPHRSAPVVHVTGTNGKTSTARMIESLLLAHDLRVGRYTSPHLERVTERISIDGEPVPDETFVRIYSEIAPYLELVDRKLEADGAPRLTYFETLTVLAFAVFADEPVDVMVLEVGIGGTWDATNVADAAVSVVTPITDICGRKATASGHVGTRTVRVAGSYTPSWGRLARPCRSIFSVLPAAHTLAVTAAAAGTGLSFVAVSVKLQPTSKARSAMELNEICRCMVPRSWIAAAGWTPWNQRELRV